MPETKTFSSPAPSPSPWAESQSLEFKASFGEWKECIEASGAFVVCFPFPDTTAVNKVGDGVGDGLSVNQTKILKFLSTAPFLSAAALSQRLGISARKTEENLATLKSLGRLRRVGSPRSGHWEVTT